jgi:hypothetical protein
MYEPIVAILSLGAPTVFRLYEKPCPLDVNSESKPGKPVLSLILPSKSLLVFRGKYYSQYLHGIDAAQQEIVDSTVVNRHLFPRQLEVPEAHVELEETVKSEGNDLEKQSSWSFCRGGTRVSLTMRNGYRKIACVQL